MWPLSWTSCLRKDRSVRQKYRPHADWIWLYCTGCYGNPYPDQRARPQNDDPSDTFYELYGKIANLCFLCQCLLSETGRPDHGWTVSSGHCCWYPDRFSVQRNIISKVNLYPLSWNFQTTECQEQKTCHSFSGKKPKSFLQKAFSIILLATIVVWFLQSFDLSMNMVTDSADSILAHVAGLFVPIFKPLGLGDWRICTSLISGVMAKESVVSTLEILFGGNITSVLTPLAAATLLVFSLLYTPCIAAIASIKRELGTHWALGVVLWQCLIAWLAAFAAHLIGTFLF